MTKVTLHPTIPLNNYAKNHLRELSFGKEKPPILKQSFEKRDLNWFGRLVRRIDDSDTLFMFTFFFSTVTIVGIPFLVFWLKESDLQAREKRTEAVAMKRLNLAAEQINQKANIIERLNIPNFEKIPTLNLNEKVFRKSIDYLQPEDLTAPIMKGLDQDGRPFIALKLDQPKKMVVTLFQIDTKVAVWEWDCENAFKHYFQREIWAKLNCFEPLLIKQIRFDETYKFFRKIVNNEHEKFVLAKETAPVKRSKKKTSEQTNIDKQAPNSPKFCSIEEQLEFFKKVRGCKVFTEDEEQIEIALKGQRVDQSTKLSPWKLHISANPENAGQILRAVREKLVKYKPHFKFVRNEIQLEEYNNFVNPMFPERGKFKEGKFATIYGANNDEILALAKELDTALRKGIEEDTIDVSKKTANHTDRPIGSTGLLWARHDQAGSPITDTDFNEGSHAASAEGTYCVTTHFPINWAFDLAPDEMEKRIKNKEKGVVIVQNEDIFEKDWGKVAWNSAEHTFELI